MIVAVPSAGCLEHIGGAADARLTQLGMTRAGLLRAVAAGDEQRNLVSPLSPRTYPGQVMWAETVTALRKELIGSGYDWVPDSTEGYETVVSDRFGLSLAVIGGNERTGRRGSPYPSTARPRGPVTMKRVANNHGLASPLPGMEILSDFPQTLTTWFLMAHAGRSGIQVELSLPVICGADGFIRAWSERVILEDVPSAGGVTPVDVETPDVPAVDVRRR